MIYDENKKFRYELKYLCSNSQIVVMEHRIQAIMRKDSNVNDQGYYTVRSLYFDDYYDSCLWDKENGTDRRKKYRIRYYGKDSSKLILEIKRKENDKIHKVSCNLTKEQYDSLTDSKIIWKEKNDNAVLNQLWILRQTKLMSPKIIVAYDRIPYVYREGNVRVTFDKGIRSSTKVNDFLNAEIEMRPIMQTGQQLVEVKFDEFLPDSIYNSLQMEGLNRIAFSKYTLCRKYS